MDENTDIRPGFLDRLSSAVKILRGTGPVLSVQPRFSEAEVIQRYYSILSSFALTAKEAPEYGDPMRDWWLRQFVFRRKAEPILVGAIYSLTAKMRSLGWRITGPKNQAKYLTQVLQEADYGDGWDPYVAKVFCQFFYFITMAHPNFKMGLGDIFKKRKFFEIKFSGTIFFYISWFYFSSEKMNGELLTITDSQNGDS